MSSEEEEEDEEEEEEEKEEKVFGLRTEWSLSTQEWDSIYRNDKIETFEKIFHLFRVFTLREIFKNACERNSLKIVNFLCDSEFPLRISSLYIGLGPTEFDFWAKILKYLVSTPNRTEMIKILIKLKPDFKILCFLYAVEIDKMDVVKFFVEEIKVDLNSIGSADDELPLMIATSKNRIEILKYLIEKGAICDLADQNKQTPLYAACLLGNLECVKVLVESGANVDGRDWSPISAACSNSRVEVVKYLLSKGANPSKSTSDGENALHFACGSGGNLEIVKVLMNEPKMNLNAKTSFGYNAFHMAVSYGNLELVKCLVESDRFNLNELTRNGESALKIAERRKFSEIVKYLKSKEPSIVKSFLDKLWPSK